MRHSWLACSTSRAARGNGASFFSSLIFDSFDSCKGDVLPPANAVVAKLAEPQTESILRNGACAASTIAAAKARIR